MQEASLIHSGCSFSRVLIDLSSCLKTARPRRCLSALVNDLKSVASGWNFEFSQLYLIRLYLSILQILAAIESYIYSFIGSFEKYSAVSGASFLRSCISWRLGSQNACFQSSQVTSFPFLFLLAWGMFIISRYEFGTTRGRRICYHSSRRLQWATEFLKSQKPPKSYPLHPLCSVPQFKE